MDANNIVLLLYCMYRYIDINVLIALQLNCHIGYFLKNLKTNNMLVNVF